MAGLATPEVQTPRRSADSEVQTGKPQGFTAKPQVSGRSADSRRKCRRLRLEVQTPPGRKCRQPASGKTPGIRGQSPPLPAKCRRRAAGAKTRSADAGGPTADKPQTKCRRRPRAFRRDIYLMRCAPRGEVQTTRGVRARGLSEEAPRGSDGANVDGKVSALVCTKRERAILGSKEKVSSVCSLSALRLHLSALWVLSRRVPPKNTEETALPLGANRRRLVALTIPTLGEPYSHGRGGSDSRACACVRGAKPQAGAPSVSCARPGVAHGEATTPGQARP